MLTIALDIAMRIIRRRAALGRPTRTTATGGTVRRGVILMALLLSACPRLPPVSGCNPGAQACINNTPHVCSTSQRWQRAGDLACSAVGGVCVVLEGRASCAGLNH